MSEKKASRQPLAAGYTPPDLLTHMEKGERILLAFSGGADSSALLDLLIRGGFAVECAHLDHMIRGAEAERDALFCASAAERYGVPVHIEHVDVPASARRHGEGLEEAARRERYAFFGRVMSERGIRLLATAHNADDNLETMLLRLARGCGARGMCGIPPVRALGGGRLAVRPILGMTKAEVLEYCRAGNIGFVFDSTNSNVEYSRNRLRARVLPELLAINPAAAAAAARLAANLRADCAYLDSLADGFVSAECRDGSVPAARLAGLARPVAARVVSRMYTDAGGTMAEEGHISAVLSILGSDEKKQISMPGGIVCTLSGGRLSFCFGADVNTKRVLPDGIYPLAEGITRLPGGFEVVIGVMPDDSFKNINIIYKVSTKAHLYADRIKGALYARPRRPGDRILQGGMHKSLKKLYCDKKIPEELRAELPVICDGDGVLWVPFVGARDGAAARDGTVGMTVAVRLAEDTKTYGYPEDNIK